jgi:NADPH:quinone reductase
MDAIVLRKHGGPESLEFSELPIPVPERGQVRIRVAAAGVNFIDVYHRTGLYPREPPFVPGSEASGTVDAVGEGVTDLHVGERVVVAPADGAYAEFLVAPAERVIRVPDGLELDEAAAAMLQGMTAHYLVHSTCPIGRGDTVLIHAAAGGVGLLLVQMAVRAGARVIGTVSTEEKADLARDAGVDDVILYTETDFIEETRRLTHGAGVQAVFDSVGQSTFAGSLGSLAPQGMLVLYGQSSGRVEPFDPALLARHGSLFLTRPSLAHYVASREELVWRAGAVLNGVRTGELKLRIDSKYLLAEATQAHRALEARRTKGKVLLIP